MKLLIINLDKSIFRPNSRSLADLKDYSRFFEKLFIISWTLKKEEPIFFENRLFVYPTNSRSRLFYILDTIKIFRKFIKGEKINLISSQDPFETGLAAFLISRILKITFHLQVHTDIFSPYFWNESFLNKIRVFLAKFLIPKARRIRVVSERIKDSLSRATCRALSVAVLPIFVDAKKIREASIRTDLHKKYPQFNFIILMASRLTREKNIGLAIDAMAEIVKKYPKTGLVIAGSGPEEKKLKVKSFRLKNNIIFETWTEDVISYYKTADLFLLTSNYEGYGMAVVEAMAAGCPVVMTDVGLAGEVLIDKKDGIIVPVGDKKRLIEVILSLIEDLELRRQLVENVKKTMAFWPIREDYLLKYRDSWQ